MHDQPKTNQELGNLQLPLFSFEIEKGAVEPEQKDQKTAYQNETLIYLLSLASVKGIGFKTLCQMFDNNLLWDVWKLDFPEITRRFSTLNNKIPKEAAITLSSDRSELLEYGEKAAQTLAQRSISFISLKDKDYPQAFLRLHEPPRWIFIQGRPEILHSHSIIAIVGTRQPSHEGESLARKCAEELAIRNFVVLSGLARGIDENVHQGAVNSYGQSIAVLGYGLDAENAYHDKALVSKLLDTNGAVISEYLPGDLPSRERFLRRNELVAALAKVVIPVESPSLESGTGATIRRALKLGTQVIGLTSPHVNSKALTETKKSLISLDIPVFAVGNGSEAFWNKLKEIYANHNWEIRPQARQERFFREILRQVIEVKDKIALDSDAVDRLAEQIKRVL